MRKPPVSPAMEILEFIEIAPIYILVDYYLERKTLIVGEPPLLVAPFICIFIYVFLQALLVHEYIGMELLQIVCIKKLSITDNRASTCPRTIYFREGMCPCGSTKLDENEHHSEYADEGCMRNSMYHLIKACRLREEPCCVT